MMCFVICSSLRENRRFHISTQQHEIECGSRFTGLEDPTLQFTRCDSIVEDAILFILVDNIHDYIFWEIFCVDDI